MLAIALCFHIDHLEAGVKSPISLPAAQIFVDAGGQRGRTLMFSCPVILVRLFTGCSTMLADTRMAYAFAREGALTFSPYSTVPSHLLNHTLLTDDLASSLTSTQPHTPP